VLDIQFDPSQVNRWIASAGNQLPFATALALNRTAKLVKDEIREEMTRVFDRPTRFALNSLATKPAKKTDLEAMVFLKDVYAGGTPAINFIGPAIFGGKRHAKSHELALRRSGILASNMFADPARDVQLDQYGNIPRAKLRKMLADLALGSGLQRTSNRQIQYFKLGNPPVGVYTRQNRQLKSFLRFVHEPVYHKRLDFFGIGQRVIDEHLVPEMIKAIEHALSTAR
jgi:hypothetical protein